MRLPRLFLFASAVATTLPIPNDKSMPGRDAIVTFRVSYSRGRGIRSGGGGNAAGCVHDRICRPERARFQCLSPGSGSRAPILSPTTSGDLQVMLSTRP